jgi:hypothetical protein
MGTGDLDPEMNLARWILVLAADLMNAMIPLISAYGNVNFRLRHGNSYYDQVLHASSAVYHLSATTAR